MLMEWALRAGLLNNIQTRPTDGFACAGAMPVGSGKRGPLWQEVNNAVRPRFVTRSTRFAERLRVGRGQGHSRGAPLITKVPGVTHYSEEGGIPGGG